MYEDPKWTRISETCQPLQLSELTRQMINLSRLGAWALILDKPTVAVVLETANTLIHKGNTVQ